jgi:hypothetical protein
MTLLAKWRKERGVRFGRKRKPEKSPDNEQIPLSEFPAEKPTVGVPPTNSDASQIETAGPSQEGIAETRSSENTRTRQSLFTEFDDESV